MRLTLLILFFVTTSALGANQLGPCDDAEVLEISTETSRQLRDYAGESWYEYFANVLRSKVRTGQGFALFANIFATRQSLRDLVLAGEASRAIGIYRPVAVKLLKAWFELQDARTQLSRGTNSQDQIKQLRNRLRIRRNRVAKFAYEYISLTKELMKLAGAKPGEQQSDSTRKPSKVEKTAQDTVESPQILLKRLNRALADRPVPTEQDLEQEIENYAPLYTNSAVYAIASRIFWSELGASGWRIVRQVLLLGGENNVLVASFKRLASTVKETEINIGEQQNIVSKVLGVAIEGVVRFAKGGRLYDEYYAIMNRDFPDLTNVPPAANWYAALKARYVAMRADPNGGSRYAFGFLVTAMRRGYGNDHQNTDWHTKLNDTRAQLDKLATEDKDPQYKAVFKQALKAAKERGLLPAIPPETNFPVVDTVSQAAGYLIYYHLPTAVEWIRQLMNQGFGLAGDQEDIAPTDGFPVYDEQNRVAEIISFDDAEQALDTLALVLSDIRWRAESGDQEAMAYWRQVTSDQDSSEKDPESIEEILSNIETVLSK